MKSINSIIDKLKEDRSVRHDLEALIVQNKDIISSSSDSVKSIVEHFENKQKDSELLLNLLKGINS